MSWTGFVFVFTAFFATHSVPLRPNIKSGLAALIGARGFSLAYSVLSLGMLTLLIWSAGRAPHVELWPPMPWHRHAVHLGMLGTCLILALSVGRPNPLSFGGARNAVFDPAHPGIVRIFRHPVLAGLALWAGLHLLPNGDLAHVLLFSILAGFAIAGRALIDRRKRREMGDARWIELKSVISKAPFISKPRSWMSLALRIMAGIVAFAALLFLHPFVIGVPVV
ncbi:NnrU family protein [Roseovarius aquimarinus]|uniref:NnrU family protein n=1 Tax=Roseovarius aquimarinus TaxID=1229156 RepID=A0ABW7IBN4_9RHOB